jgi:hypothetical protein
VVLEDRKGKREEANIEHAQNAEREGKGGD